MTRVSGPRGGGRLARSAGLVGLKPQATRPDTAAPRAVTTHVDGHTITAKSKLNQDAEQILTKLPPIPA